VERNVYQKVEEMFFTRANTWEGGKKSFLFSKKKRTKRSSLHYTIAHLERKVYFGGEKKKKTSFE
jgi:hypothetical protein